MPFSIVTTWLRGLFSLAILVVGVWLVKESLDDRSPPEDVPLQAAESNDVDLLPLLGGGLLLLLAVGGRVVSPRLWKRGGGTPAVHSDRTRTVETRRGSRLHVRHFGPETATPVVLVHGLGSDHTGWLEAIETLSRSFHVVAYDLPGHGCSPRNRVAERAIENMADDLIDVLKTLGGRKAVVMGHSMGGMIALTSCRRGSDVRDRLAGLVLVHTSPVNPFETMAPVPLHRKLQKPVHEPLLRVSAALAPVVRLLNQLAYWNGSIHWDLELQLFTGRETREQLDRMARVARRVDPAAQAHCALALTRYHAPSSLPSLEVPTLVVTGTRDHVTVPEAGETIAEELPKAEILELDPARHMGYMEWHEPFVTAVHRFIEEATSARETARKPGRPQPPPGRRRGARRVAHRSSRS